MTPDAEDGAESRGREVGHGRVPRAATPEGTEQRSLTTDTASSLVLAHHSRPGNPSVDTASSVTDPLRSMHARARTSCGSTRLTISDTRGNTLRMSTTSAIVRRSSAEMSLPCGTARGRDRVKRQRPGIFLRGRSHTRIRSNSDSSWRPPLASGGEHVSFQFRAVDDVCRASPRATNSLHAHHRRIVPPVCASRSGTRVGMWTAASAGAQRRAAGA